ncbi:MAG: HEAT repeat domain-containing protein, partial [Candidatus Omnitrophica bacterium]|nr:HEAT repeat domain-containing protein [Candidatus Omnitrophota bacterium]
VKALGLIYLELVKQGKEINFSALENKLKDDNPYVRKVAVKALGLIYLELVKQGKEINLSALENKLKDDNPYVRKVAVEALGLIYLELVKQGKEINFSALENKLEDHNFYVYEAAVQALGLIYLELVKQGKEINFSALEKKLKDSNLNVRYFAVEALGPIYLELVKQGKEINLSALENKLEDDDQYMRQAAVQALGPIYVELTKQCKITDEFFRKYTLWQREGFPYNEEIIDAYLGSSQPEVYISQIKREAELRIENGFDYNNKKELGLAFIGARIKGINISFEAFVKGIEGLIKFDRQHPGYFKQLFNKTKGLKPIEVSASGARQIDFSDIDIKVLDKNLSKLLQIAERINDFSWLKDFPQSKVFNLRNLYYQLQRTLAIQSGKIKQGERFRVDFPAEDVMQEALLNNRKLFYQIVFGLAKERLGDKQIGQPCLELMRDLIVSDILLDDALRVQMDSDQLEEKINAFKNFYEDYKNHLPNSLGLKIENIKGLARAFEELSGGVYAEIAKVKITKTKTTDTYRLVPQGFLSVFRGRAGIIDCSFDDDKGTPYTRAMHEDTLYYFVYKGKELKGYLGLMLAKDTKSGQQVLIIDTINSPSLDGEELLSALFQVLDKVAKGLGCVGIALPKDVMDFSFNFDNKVAIKQMSVYKNAAEIKVVPLHDDTWAYFTKMFGKDKYNSIEDGKFKLLVLGSASSPLAGEQPAASSPLQSFKGFGGETKIPSSPLEEAPSKKTSGFTYPGRLVRLHEQITKELEQRDFRGPLVVVDLGIGDDGGSTTVELLERLSKDFRDVIVIGVDNNEEYIQRANARMEEFNQRLLPGAKLYFVHGGFDLSKIAVNGAKLENIDLIVAANVLSHYSIRENAIIMKLLKQALDPRGILVVANGPGTKSNALQFTVYPKQGQAKRHLLTEDNSDYQTWLPAREEPEKTQSSSPLATQDKGGIDLTSIKIKEMDLGKDAPKNPVDRKIYFAQQMFKQGWEVLAVLYLKQAISLLRHNVASDYQQKDLFIKLLSVLQQKEQLDEESINFFEEAKNRELVPLA